MSALGVTRPLIVLGAARSGTTLLGHLLASHPDVAYWEEPVHIWRHGHAYRQHDVLTAKDATPRVRRYIRAQFGKFLARSGRSRFAEKTPSNCFRVPFIHEVFPDAVFIHLIRDGRAVAVSAMGQWVNDVTVSRQEGDRNSSYVTTDGQGAFQRVSDAAAAVAKFVREKRRLTGGIGMWLEAPAQVPGLVRVIARKLTTDRSFVWGPRFPGMAAIHRRYSLLETCALQWAASVQSTLTHTRSLPPDRLLEIRYEALVRDPVTVTREVCEFADLSLASSVQDYAVDLRRGETPERWRERLCGPEVEALEAWLAPLLVHLGYQTSVKEHSVRPSQSASVVTPSV